MELEEEASSADWGDGTQAWDRQRRACSGSCQEASVGQDGQRAPGKRSVEWAGARSRREGRNLLVALKAGKHMLSSLFKSSLSCCVGGSSERE